jgi:hypothetical protein
MIDRNYIYRHPETYVTRHYPSARRSFYPGGPDVSVRVFQSILKDERVRLDNDLLTLQSHGLAARVKLGRESILFAKQRANYLYENNIHAGFFAETMHLLARQAAALAPLVDAVNLKRLGRESIEQALKGGRANHTDFGHSFELFGAATRTDRERLEILEKLGVLKLSPGRSLPPKPYFQQLLPV